MPRAKSSYHHPNLRQALLEAAARELEEKGPDELSLRGIAARAGVSHTAPYRHFKSKDELLGELLLSTSERFSTALREAFESSDPSNPVAGLMALGDAYEAFAAKYPQEIGLMFSSLGTTLVDQQVASNASIDPAKHDSFETLEKVAARYLASVPRSSSETAERPQALELALLFWSFIMGQVIIEREGFLKRISQARGVDLEETRQRVGSAFAFLLSRK